MSGQRIVLTLVICLCAARASYALPPFRKPLDKRYAATDGELLRELRRANCNLCHIKNKKREFVNSYGKLLADLIPGNAKDRLATAAARGKQARDAEYANVMRELSEAVKKADGLQNSDAVTYGELFRTRTLPAGDDSYALRDKSSSVTHVESQIP